jgi:CHAT domain-containing protein/tetratricopeptide (TPR) repeat protein
MKNLVATLVVLLMVSTASAQPWPAPNPRGASQLGGLITAATQGKAVERLPSTDPKAPASFRLADPAKLKAVFLAGLDALSDETCDACVLNWRDAPGPQKPFWGQWLRGMAEASNRPRATGLADLLEAVLLPGDADSQARAFRLMSSAREHFHNAKDLAWEAAAENQLGLYALNKDQFDDADARFKKAGELYARAFHPRHRLVASTLRNRGNGPAKRQDYASAVRYYRQAADLLDTSDPGAAAERVAILQNLSSVYFAQSDMTSAIGPIREATEILTKLGGPNDPALLPFLENLGGIYFSRGENDRALETARKAYEIAQAAFGPEDPRVARYLGDFADRSRWVGHAKEAIEGHRKAISILEKAAVKDEGAIGDLRQSIGDDLRDLQDPAGAIGEYRAAVEHYRRNNGRNARIKAAMAVSRIASVNDSLGRVKEAGECYRQAIADLTNATDSSHPILLVFYEGYGLHLLRNGQHLRAAEQYRVGHDLARKLGREVDQAMQAERLAHAYRLADDQDKALAAVNEAIGIFRKSQHPKLANAYSTLAAIHFSKGEDEEAVKYDRLAFEFMRSISKPDDPDVITLGNIVALHLQRAGKFAEAEPMFRESANFLLRRLGPKDPAYASAVVALANCQAEAGRLRDADKTLDGAIAILRQSASPRPLVSALIEKARLQARVKQNAPAIKSYRDALDVIVASGLAGSELHAHTLRNLGNIARDAGDLRLADESFGKAVAIYRALKASLSPFAMSCIKALALVRSEMGDLPTALQWIDQGLAALATVGPANRPTYLAREATVDLLNTKAEFLIRVDARSPATWKKAYEALATAAEVADRLRVEQKTTVESKQRMYNSSRYESVILRLNLCEMLVEPEPGAKWLGEAFRTSEESKARVFLEQLGRSRSAVIGGLSESLAVREAGLRERLARLDRDVRQNEVASFDTREPGRTAESLGQIAEAEHAMDEVQSQIARDYPLVASLRRPNPCNVEQARACLAPDEVALIYTCGARVGYVILVKPPAGDDPVGLAMIPVGGTADFGEKLGILSDPDALQVRDFYEKAGADLYRMLITPVENQIEGKNLVIVPDGPLALLNFEVLRDPTGKFLIETRRIRYAPSMTALHLNRTWESRRPKPTRPFLGIGDPVYTPDDPRLGGRPFPRAALATLERLGEALPRLTSASREVREAGQTAGAPKEDLWIGLDASETRLKEASGQGRLSAYRFVHFATHGQLGSGSDRPPALVLSLTEGGPDVNSPANDGIFTIGEASALQLNADLVVLSGCHTARGELALGEGVTGLARAFLIAGTRGVVCSLWTLDDTDATDAMRQVYRSIVAGQPPAVALRQAKLKMIREGQTPFRWAPLILIGR